MLLRVKNLPVSSSNGIQPTHWTCISNLKHHSQRLVFAEFLMTTTVYMDSDCKKLKNGYLAEKEDEIFRPFLCKIWSFGSLNNRNSCLEIWRIAAASTNYALKEPWKQIWSCEPAD